MNPTEPNDTRLILEALRELLELHDSPSPVLAKITSRLENKASEIAPRREIEWQPEISAKLFNDPNIAVLFCNRRSSKGFTAEYMRKIGVPYPQPPRWKRHLQNALVVRFGLVREGRDYKLPKKAAYLNDTLDQQ